jgi:hypothetical protein
MAAAPGSLAYSARQEHGLKTICPANPERGVKSFLVVFAIWLAGCCLAHAQDDAPGAEMRRQIDKAVGLAIAADTLCGTAYLQTVLANGQSDGFTLDDLMRATSRRSTNRPVASSPRTTVRNSRTSSARRSGATSRARLRNRAMLGCGSIFAAPPERDEVHRWLESRHS